MKCPHCGREAQQEGPFCGFCGTPLGAQPQPRQPYPNMQPTQPGVYPGAQPRYPQQPPYAPPVQPMQRPAPGPYMPYGAPPVPPKPKKKKGLTIFLIVLAALVVIAAIVLVVSLTGRGRDDSIADSDIQAAGSQDSQAVEEMAPAEAVPPEPIPDYVPMEILAEVSTSHRLDSNGEQMIDDVFRVLYEELSRLQSVQSISDEDIYDFSENVYAAIDEFDNAFFAQYEINVDLLPDADKGAAFNLMTDGFELTVSLADHSMYMVNYLDGTATGQELLESAVRLINTYAAYFYGQDYVTAEALSALTGETPSAGDAASSADQQLILNAVYAILDSEDFSNWQSLYQEFTGSAPRSAEIAKIVHFSIADFDGKAVDGYLISIAADVAWWHNEAAQEGITANHLNIFFDCNSYTLYDSITTNAGNAEMDTTTDNGRATYLLWMFGNILNGSYEGHYVNDTETVVELTAEEIALLNAELNP